MGDGFGVDPQRLQATGEGIDAVISELETLGLGAAARTGNNFGNLALDGMQLGHAGLTQAMSEFCDRWSWGVRGLVQEGSKLALGLGLAAGTYHENEKYNEGVLKDLLGSLAGDPHATEEQLEAGSFNDIIDSASVTPDHSAESMDKALAHMGTTWTNTGADVVDTAVDRLNTPSRIASAVTGQQLPTIPHPFADQP
jgi:hypothetical protein